MGKPDLLTDLLKLPSPNHSELLFVHQRGTEPNQEGLLSNPSPPSDSATNGEIIVQSFKSLPEALEKFSKCPLILQLRERPQLQPPNIVPSSDCTTLGKTPMLETIPDPGAGKLNRVTAIKTRPRCFNRLWRQIAVKTYYTKHSCCPHY